MNIETIPNNNQNLIFLTSVRNHFIKKSKKSGNFINNSTIIRDVTLTTTKNDKSPRFKGNSPIIHLPSLDQMLNDTPSPVDRSSNIKSFMVPNQKSSNTTNDKDRDRGLIRFHDSIF